jgi:sulfide:quinone oxidoreductase
MIVWMRHRIVILGAGTGGTLTANRLHKVYGDSAEVVIDRDDRHVYQPGLLFVPFGLAEPGALVRPRHAQLHDGIEFRVAEVDRVETTDNVVYLAGGETIGYDVLVVATGASLLPEETEGLSGPGWEEKIFTFYTLEGATALRDRLRSFDRGAWSLTWSICPSSARWRRLSSAFSPTGICGSVTFVTGSRSRM